MRCACVTKFTSDESVITTCAEAMALFWYRDHACSSCTEATPGICHSFFSGASYAGECVRLVYNFEVMLHVVNIDSEWNTFQQYRAAGFHCCKRVSIRSDIQTVVHVPRGTADARIRRAMPTLTPGSA